MYQRVKKLMGGSEDSDMQLIGCLLSCASRGDRVGLNQMLREGISPNVQDYDLRTALHLAASEGHAPIVELLIEYGADVNLEDRWFKTVAQAHKAFHAFLSLVMFVHCDFIFIYTIY